ncbi:MAG TPA: hypothetical protein VJT31_15435 [Rugosimonospora sp.]|nr:hypothetical protein [Rugosimonospora sp.]
MPAQQPDSVELDPTRVEARVDLILHDNEPVPVLVIVDGGTVVELPAVDPVAAARAALRIAVAANDLASRLVNTPPTCVPDS